MRIRIETVEQANSLAALGEKIEYDEFGMYFEPRRDEPEYIEVPILGSSVIQRIRVR